jgi:antitoxin component HigA of HigAB toxin-antitoxin module
MAKKKKIIRTLHGDAVYQLALNEIERCFDREPEAGAPAADLLDKLAIVIETDEREGELVKMRGSRPRKRDGYSSFSVVKYSG